MFGVIDAVELHDIPFGRVFGRYRLARSKGHDGCS
jgi:hypothetical protein